MSQHRSARGSTVVRGRPFIAALALAVAELLAPTATIPQQAAAPATPAAAPATSPAANTYSVEIVVFRNPGAQGGEDLGEATGSIVGQDSDSDSGAARSARLLQVLPATRYKLNDVVAKLNSSGSHRTLAHAAWLQTASAWNSHSGITAEQLGLGSTGVSGLIYLERGQYLHLGLDLGFAPAGGRYSLAETRRVRLNERHYFDHPAFGVIAIVTPATTTDSP